jgi:cellulose synthase/poly-beta-1,6-N-acetylglucosamine synthase-like glycosyltransferase
MLLTFFLPSYNEEQILEKNSLKLLYFLKAKNYSFDWKIALLINGSNDNSENIADKLISKYQEIYKYIITEKGRGNAIKTFLDHSEADYNIYMDVDLAVSLENIDDLLSELLNKNQDIAIGSRLKRGAKTDRSFSRELSSRVYILLSKIILRHPFSDLQCGFKGIKKEAWQKISPFIQDKKWFFDTEMLAFAKQNKLKIGEIAVNWSENRYEKRKSKVKVFRDSVVFIKELIKLKKRLKNKS